MSITPVKRIVSSTNESPWKYRTADMEEFLDLEEAIDHENELNRRKPQRPVEYEKVWTVQEAINKAAAEKRVVRFLWTGSNTEIKKGIVDKKGCSLMKPDRNSHDVAVIPPNVHDFDFQDVDMRMEVNIK